MNCSNIFQNQIKKPSNPTSIAELISRADSLAGQSLENLAKQYKQQIPPNLLHSKGWIGQFIEYILGATAGNQAAVDFPNLGIELKTIPLDTSYQPIESTYVCTSPLKITTVNWLESWVYKKLKHVLWVPIVVEKNQPIGLRKIATPFLWQANEQQLQVLQQDWEELMEFVQLGEIESLSAKYGKYLHIRPKAANSQILTCITNTQGEQIYTVPKGFYLRSKFTAELLKQEFIY